MSQRLMANNADAPETPEFLIQRNRKLLVTPDAVDGPVTAALMSALLETMTACLIEMRVQTHYLREGLSVSDEPETLRIDHSNATTIF